jgi:hypothetical protein
MHDARYDGRILCIAPAWRCGREGLHYNSLFREAELGVGLVWNTRSAANQPEHSVAYAEESEKCCRWQEEGNYSFLHAFNHGMRPRGESHGTYPAGRDDHGCSQLVTTIVPMKTWTKNGVAGQRNWCKMQAQAHRN